MTVEKKARKSANVNAQSTASQPEKPIALTLKIDSKTYVRLSTLRARERKTAQQILTDALSAYLDRVGA